MKVSFLNQLFPTVFIHRPNDYIKSSCNDVAAYADVTIPDLSQWEQVSDV